MDTSSPLQTIELLKAAKPLFENGDGYWIATVGALGAIGGALAAYFPNRWLAKRQTEIQRKSTAFQIYAEIKATLEVERCRQYSAGIKSIVQAFDQGTISSYTYQIQVPDDRYIIYRANLSNLGLLPPKLQEKIVLLYQLIEAVVQDIKPGGILNAAPVGRDAFVSAMQLLEQAKQIGEEVLVEIEKIYPDVT